MGSGCSTPPAPVVQVSGADGASPVLAPSADGAQSESHADGMSSRGVSLRLLQLLRDRAEELRMTEGPERTHRTLERPPSRRKPGTPLTTEDVSFEIVGPATRSLGCSYAHLLSGAHAHLAPLGSREDVGRANAFVSHAWSYNFADLVGALESAAVELAFEAEGGKGDGRPAGELYLWVDLLVNGQHQTYSRPFEWWTSTFFSAVRRIGRTIVVLSPWHAPTPLTRAWCLYELHCTVVAAAPLFVHMPAAERAAFERALCSDFASIADALSAVDLGLSEASRASDRDAILAAVRAGTGLHELNVQVSAAFRSWLLAAGRAALARAEAEDAERHGPLKRPLVLRNQLAVLSREQGDWEGAELLFAEELGACEVAAGGDEADENWLLALNNMAAILVRRGRYAEAEPLLARALACRERAHGPAHAETLVVVGNLAALLLYRGQLKRAERLASRAYRGRLQELGEEHASTAIAASSLALCKLDRGDHAEAERLGRHALACARKAVGLKHPTSLNLQSSLALILTCAGEALVDEAERLSADALAAHERQSGRSHVDTLLARATHGLARAQRTGLVAAEARLAGIADARATLQALCAPPHELPENHWHVVRLRRALEQLGRGPEGCRSPGATEATERAADDDYAVPHSDSEQRV